MNEDEKMKIFSKALNFVMDGNKAQLLQEFGPTNLLETLHHVLKGNKGSETLHGRFNTTF